MNPVDAFFNTLSRSIRLTGQKFSLTLAHCNYESIKNSVLEKFSSESSIKVQHIVLHANTISLFDVITKTVKEKHPDAVIISGLETAKLLDSILIRANNIREEFRNHFSFPIIFWVNNDVYSRFIHKSPDFKNWSKTIDFTLEDDELLSFFQERVQTVFDDILNSETHSFTFTDEEEFGTVHSPQFYCETMISLAILKT